MAPTTVTCGRDRSHRGGNRDRPPPVVARVAGVTGACAVPHHTAQQHAATLPAEPANVDEQQPFRPHAAALTSAQPRSGSEHRARRRSPPGVRPRHVLPAPRGRSDGPLADAVLRRTEFDRPSRPESRASGDVCWLHIAATNVGTGRVGSAPWCDRFTPPARSGHTRHRPIRSSRALSPSLHSERAAPHLI